MNLLGWLIIETVVYRIYKIDHDLHVHLEKSCKSCLTTFFTARVGQACQSHVRD